jgi:hypothetical protein
MKTQHTLSEGGVSVAAARGGNTVTPFTIHNSRFTIQTKRSTVMNTILSSSRIVALFLVLCLVSVVALGQDYVNNGAFTNTGVFRVTNFTNAATGTVDNTGILGVRGTLTNNAAAADFDTENGTVEYRGLNTAQTVISNIKNSTYGQLQLLRGGTKTLGGNVTVQGLVTLNDAPGGSGTTLAVSTHTLTLKKTDNVFSFVGGTGQVTSAATGTIDYAAAGNQNVIAIDYGNLTFSNSGTKTLATGTTNIRGNFTISGSAVADARTNNTTVDYSGSGAQSIAQIDYRNLTLSNAGTKTFAAGTTRIDGNFTITGSASADARTNSTTIEFDGNAQNVAAMDYDNLTFANTGTKTLASGTTKIRGSFSLTGSAAADLTTNSTTVEYDGTTQSVLGSVTYYNLITSNSGTKTASNNITINNNFDNGGPSDNNVTFNMGTFTLTLGSGTTDNTNATIQFGGASNGLLITTGTVEYNGTVDQNIAGHSSNKYYNLVLSGNSTKNVLAGGANTVHTSNDLTVNSGVTLAVASNGILNVDQNMTISSGGTLTNNNNGNITVLGNLTNNGSITNAGTITVGSE